MRPVNKIGEQVLGLETLWPEPQQLNLLKALCQAEEQGQHEEFPKPDVETFNFVELQSLKVQAIVSNTLKCYIASVADDDPNVALALLAAADTVAVKNNLTAVGITHLAQHLNYNVFEERSLKRLASDEATKKILQSPSSWSV